MNVGDLVWIKNIDFSVLPVQSSLKDLRIVNELTSTETSFSSQGSSATTDGNIFFRLNNKVYNGACDTNYALYYTNAFAHDVNQNRLTGIETFENTWSDG